MSALVVEVGDVTRVFTETFTVGRMGRGADLELDDEYVSNLHARFRPDGDGWTVGDLGSTNGTFLNGYPHPRARIYATARLGKGDKVTIGHTTLTVVPA